MVSCTPFYQGEVKSFSPAGLRQYGEIALVLRPEVNWRTTMSEGDSLLKYFTKYGIKTNYQTACRGHKEFSDKIASPMQDSTLSDHQGICSYLEAQVWGEIDLSDISEVRIPSDHPELLNVVRNAGIPVYSYRGLSLHSADPSAIGVEKEQILFPGDDATARILSKIRENRIKNRPRWCQSSYRGQ